MPTAVAAVSVVQRTPKTELDNATERNGAVVHKIAAFLAVEQTAGLPFVPTNPPPPPPSPPPPPPGSYRVTSDEERYNDDV